jgi:uncharacterized protein YdhG (YjbR/CyaY superfamily)
VEQADNKVKIAPVFFGERAFERYIYRQFKGTFKLPISPPLNTDTVDYTIRKMVFAHRHCEARSSRRTRKEIASLRSQ